MDKSKLDTFKDFLHSKLKKGRKQESQVKDQEGLFHGFSEDEVLSASLNDSSSERSSIISSLSNEEKNEKKKRRSEAKAAAAAARAVSDAAPGDRGVPLLHQSLVVEGKRQKKLSFKLQEKNDASQARKARSKSVDTKSDQSSGRETKDETAEGLQRTVELYASAVTAGSKETKGDDLKQIEAILQSGWKKDKKAKPAATPPPAKEDLKKKVLLKESVLEVVTPAELPILHELNDNALKLLRKPGGADKVCGQVQACLRGTSTKPPQLLRNPEKSWVNPTGAALTQMGQKQGNIVCGVCGLLTFAEDVSQQLGYGTHLCSSCSSFLATLLSHKSGSKSLDCRGGKGLCLILASSQQACPACWLLLILLGCEIPSKTFAELKSLLPEVLKNHPDSTASSVGNAGKVLVCSQRLSLDQALTEQTADSLSSSSITSEDILGHFTSTDVRRSVVHETLPNSWTKKAVRRAKGSMTGKWDVYLITPDHQVLRSQQQLKVFTAKTGAVIDSNVINFNLPQRTNLMESQLKMLNSKINEKKSVAESASKTSKCSSKSIERTENDNTSEVSSKRVTKTPKKFEDYQPQKKTSQIVKSAPIEQEQTQSPGRYECNKCEKEFKKKSHLDEHDLIHAGEKPHKCDKCGWSFRRKDKMKKHMETCNYVNRESEYAAYLKPDKRKSTDEGINAVLTASTSSSRWTAGIYVCEICQKDCGYRQNLYIHMKRHEKNGEWKRPETGPMFPKLTELARSRPESPIEVPMKRGRGRPKKDDKTVQETQIVAKSSRKFKSPSPAGDVDEQSKVGTDMTDPLEEKIEAPVTKDQRTKWRGGAPPSYWVWGRYICEICKKDCGYANNLGLHRKRSHGLSYRQERLGYNGEIERGSKVKQNPNEPGYGMSKRKRTREREENGNGSRFVTKAMPCFECEACKSEDCLHCKWCHDKKKNGGPGRLNKRCIKRRCTQPKIVEMIEHTTNRPVKMMRLEEGGKSEVYYTTTPVRTTYLQAGGLVKAMPCRNCSACLMEDCGTCRYCLDKRKFGGPGKMNKRCREKQCLTPKEFGAPSTVRPDYVRKMPEFVSSKFLEEGEKPRKARDNNTSYDNEAEEEDEKAEEDEIPDHKFSLKSFVSMGLDARAATPDYLDNIEMEEFSKERGRQGDTPKKAVKTIPVNVDKLSPSKCNVAVDFFEPFDKDEVAFHGSGVISSEMVTGEDLCFTCGTSGGGKMLYCVACCEPHHPFCLAQEDLPSSDLEEEAWVCTRCSVCKVCGGGAQGDEGERCCDICRHLFHADCLPPDQKEMKGEAWSCGSCVQCAGCGSGSVVHSTDEEPLCAKCCRARLRGSYCPVCKGCYEDNDYEQAMIECGKCGGWVHAKCEGLDGEEYQVLSLLPDSVEYVCKCPPVPPSSAPPPTAVRSRPLSVPPEAPLAMPASAPLPAAPLAPLPVLQPTPGSPLHRAHTPVLQSLNEVQLDPSSVNELAFAQTFPNLSMPVNVDIPLSKVDMDNLEADMLYQPDISPRPSEAIDDECDFVTLDSSIFALPTSIETTDSVTFFV